MPDLLITETSNGSFGQVLTKMMNWSDSPTRERLFLEQHMNMPVLKLFLPNQAPQPTDAERDLQEQKSLFNQIAPNVIAGYTGRFVASRNGQILDSDMDLDSLVERFFTRYGERPAYITKVGGKIEEFIDSPF